MFIRSAIKPLRHILSPRCGHLVLTYAKTLHQKPAFQLSHLYRGYAIKVGDMSSLTKTYTASDVQTFADLTLDFNPVHLDEAYAKGTPFGRPIVHGILTLG